MSEPEFRSACECIYAGDSGRYDCSLPAGHPGDHEARFSFADEDCYNAEHEHRTVEARAALTDQEES